MCSASCHQLHQWGLVASPEHLAPVGCSALGGQQDQKGREGHQVQEEKLQGCPTVRQAQEEEGTSPEEGDMACFRMGREEELVHPNLPCSGEDSIQSRDHLGLLGRPGLQTGWADLVARCLGEVEPANHIVSNWLFQ